jgi:hypothetical protein
MIKVELQPILKTGVRISGNRKEIMELHELVSQCWDVDHIDFSPEENMSYIGVISYFAYEIRHAFMGNRIIEYEGKYTNIELWSHDMYETFENDMEHFTVGFELPWTHILFIMASWWECYRHIECPTELLPIMRDIEQGIADVIQESEPKNYQYIEPYLHGAIYAANPYLMHAMEQAEYLYKQAWLTRRPTMKRLAEFMTYGAYGTSEYTALHKSLERNAKKYGCSVGELRLGKE